MVYIVKNSAQSLEDGSARVRRLHISVKLGESLGYLRGLFFFFSALSTRNHHPHTTPTPPFFEISKDNFQAQRILMHFGYFKSQYYGFIS